MSKHRIRFGLAAFAMILAYSVSLAGEEKAEAKPGKLILKEGWAIQSSAKVKAAGEVISQAEFKPADWYSASMPSTVLAALVANKVYPDPYFGLNLSRIPGNFGPPLDVSAFYPSPLSPFAHSWWYRTAFELPAEFKGKKIWLNFDGMNFRENIWLNGRRIATNREAAGAFRMFEFDVTEIARPGKTNTLAVEVFPPKHRDLAFTWVDWNPAPPDRNMGIWREVYLTTSGPVTLRFPQVITRLDLPSLETAHLEVNVEVRNTSGQKVSGTLQGRIGVIKFAQEVELEPQETREVIFSPDKFTELNFSKPRLWWPAQLGPQNLYDLGLEFESNGEISDCQAVRFGIREISSELNETGARVFKINGQKILIRGGGWSSDMMLRHSPEKMEAEIRYAKGMNLNTIRSEGKPEQDLFYELCDEYGILVLAGWCCCDQWEKWWSWDKEDYQVSEASLRDQIRRLRNHPSVLAWMNGSDNPPPPEVEKTYLKVLETEKWPNPSVSSATEKPTPVSGPSGVKMNGPYEWVPPIYWLADTKRGGAFSFNTETSPGPAVPPVESLRLMLPPEHLWPIDEYWNYHSGRGQFGNLHVFTNALNARYGPAKDLEDYAKKSQAMTYEGERAMFEAYARNKYVSTGVIQWMMNNAWPSLIWHLYDYYLRPAGGYFGTQKACEPLHVQYSYDDRSIVVVNSLDQEFADLKVSAQVLDLDLKEKFSKVETLQVLPDSSNRVFTLPELKDLTTTYFLKLELKDAEGKTKSRNFYWLSTKPDVLAPVGTWYYTPTAAYADFTGLETLPTVELKAAAAFETNGQEGLARVTLENPTANLAFMVRLKIVKGTGEEELLPVFWEDNYFPLFPGEKREISATYRGKDLGEATPVLEVGGWNVAQKSYP